VAATLLGAPQLVAKKVALEGRRISRQAGFVDAAFPGDAGGAVLSSGSSPGGHHESTAVLRRRRPGGEGQGSRWDGESRKLEGPTGFGDVGMPGRGCPHQGAAGPLTIVPPAIEGPQRVVASKGLCAFIWQRCRAASAPQERRPCDVAHSRRLGTSIKLL
jgi:hypothetical protein